LPASNRAVRNRAPTCLSARPGCLRMQVILSSDAGYCSWSLHRSYFDPHFVSRASPIVPPEITSPCTGLPRNMILVSSVYAFGPDLFQALHGASMRHSLNLLAVQVNAWAGPSSARVGTVGPINNIDALNMVECRGITVSDEVDGSENNECAAFRRPQAEENPKQRVLPLRSHSRGACAAGEQALPGKSAPQ
jgi:hypothetical protein